MTDNSLESASVCETPAHHADVEIQTGTSTSVPNGSGHKKFPRGEILKPEPVKLEPIDAVNKFVGHRTASVNEAVLSTIAAAEAIDAFEGDSAKSQQWLGNMVRVKALTKTEASSGLMEEKKSASNLSKLRKIAKYEHILRAPKIASLLPSGGFATLYECAKLGELLEEQNPATTVDTLQMLLVQHDGPVTRDWLKKQRDKLRPPKPAKDIEVAPTLAENPTERSTKQETHESHEVERAQPAKRRDAVIQSGAENPIERDDHVDFEETDEGDESDEAVTAVLMTPNSHDVSRFTNNLLGVGKVAGNIGDDAVLLVYAPLGSVLSMSEALELFGMERCEQIYLLSQPSAPDVTDSPVLAVYVRGEAKPAGSIDKWMTEMDPIRLADLILDGISGRKIHLFAESQSEGWESTIGGENWNTGAVE